VTLVAIHVDAKEQKSSYSSESECEGEIDAKVETRAVRVLLEHGADVAARDNAHSTPLHVASSKGNGETVKLLIRHGTDVNAQDGRCRAPLHQAAYSRLAFKRTSCACYLALAQM
jgi:ankyrin repeat protein